MKKMRMALVLLISLMFVLGPSIGAKADGMSYKNWQEMNEQNTESNWTEALTYDVDDEDVGTPFDWPSEGVDFSTSYHMIYEDSMTIPSNVTVTTSGYLKVKENETLTIQGTFNANSLYECRGNITIEDGGKLFIATPSRFEAGTITIKEGGILDIGADEASLFFEHETELILDGGEIVSNNPSGYQHSINIFGKMIGRTGTQVKANVNFWTTTIYGFDGEEHYIPEISGDLTFLGSVDFYEDGIVIINTDTFPLFLGGVSNGKAIIPEGKNYIIKGSDDGKENRIASLCLVVNNNSKITLEDKVLYPGFVIKNGGEVTFNTTMDSVSLFPYFPDYISEYKYIIENGGKLVIPSGLRVSIDNTMLLNGEVVINEDATLMLWGTSIIGSGKITGNGTLYLNRDFGGEGESTFASTITIGSGITVMKYGQEGPVNPPSHNHEYTITVAAEIPATCTAKGKTAVKKCSKCSATIGGADIPKLDHTIEETIKAATTKADGSIVKACSVCHEEISRDVIAKAFVTIEDTAKYTGKAIKQAVKVTDTAGKKISNKFYTVTYKNNINVGKATVTVTFKGNYSGKVNKTFTIVNKSDIPGKVAGLKLSAGKKAFTVGWNKGSANVDGYEIQYSTDKNFLSSVKTVKITKAETVTKTISKLKAKTTYYVRIRAYNKEGKTTAYSAWSAKKTVKTK